MISGKRHCYFTNVLSHYHNQFIWEKADISLKIWDSPTALRVKQQSTYLDFGVNCPFNISLYIFVNVEGSWCTTSSLHSVMYFLFCVYFFKICITCVCKCAFSSPRLYRAVMVMYPLLYATELMSLFFMLSRGKAITHNLNIGSR